MAKAKKTKAGGLPVALFYEGELKAAWRGMLHDFCRDNEMDYSETLAQFTPGALCAKFGGGAAPTFRLVALGW